MDIAPLGFSVDTSGLDSASKAADTATDKLNRVADATDKVGKSSEEASGKVKKIADAVKEHGSTASDAADGVKKHGEATKDAGEAVAAHTEQLKAHHAQLKIITGETLTAAEAAKAHAAALKEARAQHIEPLPAIGATVPRSAGAQTFQSNFFAQTKPPPDKFDQEMQAKQLAMIDRLSASVDPTAVKLSKLTKLIEESGKAADTGALSHKRYVEILDKAGKQIDVLEARQRGEHASPRGWNPMFQELRAGLQGIPGFGRIGTAIAGEATSGMGMGSMLKLGAMGGLGLVAGEGIAKGAEWLMELPKRMIEAGDESERLKRHLTALGETDAAKGLEEIETSANRMGVKLGTAAAMVDEYRTSLIRYNDAEKQRKVIEATSALGSLGGLTEEQKKGAVSSVGRMIDQPLVQATSLQALYQQAPNIVEQIAKGIGRSQAGLMQLASEGQLTGAMVGDALARGAEGLSKKLSATTPMWEEMTNRADNAFSKMFSALDARLHNSDFFKWWKNFEVNFANQVTHIAERHVETRRGHDGLLGTFREHDGFLGIFSSAPRIRHRGDLADEPMQIEVQGGTSAQARAIQQAFKDGKPIPSFNSPAVAPPPSPGGISDADRTKASLLVQEGASVQTSRDLALAKARELGEYITKVRESGTAADRAQLPAAEAAKREFMRLAEGIRTPLQNLAKETQAIGDAAMHGAGGIVALRRQAQQLADEQNRSRTSAGALPVTADEMFQRLLDKTKIESEGDLKNQGHQIGVLQQQAKLLAGAGVGGDKLEVEAKTEGATWAFQKFGDGVKVTDNLVQRYIETLYRLKLAMRDVADETQANQLAKQAAVTGAGASALFSGAGAAAAERAQNAQQRELDIRESAIATRGALPGASYTVQGYGSSAGFGGGGDPSGGDVHVGGGGGARFDALVRDWTARGHPLWRARGLAAGEMSESSGDPTSVNRKSGAIGLGQLLGTRKQRYLSTYGNDRSIGSENEYLDWELHGGDPGGAAVMGAKDEASVARAYIAKFMRPGKDTPGGIRRALKALGLKGGGGAEGSDLAGALATQTYTFEGMAALIGGVPYSATRKYDAEDLQRNAALAQRGGHQYDAMYQARLMGEAALPGIANDNTFSSKQAQQEREIARIREDYAGVTVRDNQGRLRSVAELLVGEKKLTNEYDHRHAIAVEEGRLKSDHEALEDELKLTKYIGEELRIQTELLRYKRQLEKEGVLTPAEIAAQVAAREAQMHRDAPMKKQIEQIKDLKNAATEAAQNIGKAFIDEFDNAFRTGKHLGQTMLNGLAEAGIQAMNRILQNVVVNPLVKALEKAMNAGINALMGGGFSGGGGGGFGGGGASGEWALGGAFSNGSVVPFARGGVFNTATRVAMANGGTGLIGEGPGDGEAVMPLKRGADGKLGVATRGGGGGGGTSVQIIDMRSGRDAKPIEVQERSTSDGKRQLQIMVADSVRGAFRRGEFDVDQQTQFGLSRSTARR